jgi:hypothetical protein
MKLISNNDKSYFGLLFLSFTLLSFVSFLNATIIQARWLESKNAKKIVLLFGDCHDRSHIQGGGKIHDVFQMNAVMGNFNLVASKYPSLPVMCLVEGDRGVSKKSKQKAEIISKLCDTCNVFNDALHRYKNWGGLLFKLTEFKSRVLEHDYYTINFCTTEDYRSKIIDFEAIMRFINLTESTLLDAEDHENCDRNVCHFFGKKSLIKVQELLTQYFGSKITNTTRIIDDIISLIKHSRNAIKSFFVLDSELSNRLSSDLDNVEFELYTSYKGTLNDSLRSNFESLTYVDLYNSFVKNIELFPHLSSDSKYAMMEQINKRMMKFWSKLVDLGSIFLDIRLLESILSPGKAEQKQVVVVFAGASHIEDIAQKYLSAQFIEKKYAGISVEEAEQEIKPTGFCKALDLDFLNWILEASQEVMQKKKK